jgi:hypothetical protein
MTIYFSEDVNHFLPIFNDQYNRILQITDPLIFFSLYFEFIDKLSVNTLLGPALSEAENKSQKEGQKFNALMLKAIDNNLTRLTRYHSLKYKKKLVAIRKMIRQPDIISRSPLYSRIVSALEQFVRHSPFCKILRKSLQVFETSQEQFDKALKQSCYIRPKQQRYGLEKKIVPVENDRLQLSKRIFSSESDQILSLLQKEVEWISPDINLSFPKPLNANYMTETNMAFCWHKMKFLQKCWLFKDRVQLTQIHKGKWSLIKETAWNVAVETDHKVELLRTKQQITEGSLALRKNCEELMKSLRNHFHAEVYQIQNNKIKHQEPSLDSRGATQACTDRIEAEDRITKHAHKYWIDFRLASHPEVFADYKKTNPKNSYAFTKWKKIIKDHRLDPRTDEEKKQRSGRRRSVTQSKKIDQVSLVVP